MTQSPVTARLGRKVLSCIILYIGLHLTYALIIGGIEMLLASYPTEVKARFTILILIGFVVGISLAGLGMKLWAGLRLASIITIIIALLLLLSIYVNAKPKAATLQAVAAALILVGGVVGIVLSSRAKKVTKHQVV